MWGVSGQLHALAILLPGKHWIQGWEDPTQSKCGNNEKTSMPSRNYLPTLII